MAIIKTSLFVLLLNVVSQVMADYHCYGLCDWDQHCCGDMLCCDDFIIWRVWYFWFLIILFIVILSSCGAFCRYRRRTIVVPSYQPITTTHVSTYETVQPVAPAIPRAMQAPPAYTAPAPPPPYSAPPQKGY